MPYGLQQMHHNKSSNSESMSCTIKRGSLVYLSFRSIWNG